MKLNIIFDKRPQIVFIKDKHQGQTVYRREANYNNNRNKQSDKQIKGHKDELTEKIRE